MGITIDMWFEIASFIVGGIFVYFQWEKSVKTKRAEIIHQIIDKLRFDEDLIKATYILDITRIGITTHFIMVITGWSI